MRLSSFQAVCPLPSDAFDSTRCVRDSLQTLTQIPCQVLALQVLVLRCSLFCAAMLEACLAIATMLAAEMKRWAPEKIDGLEACREACRSVCCHVGITEDTDCMAKMWTIITMAQVKLENYSGYDIDPSNMCAPPQPEGLESMNVYQRNALRSDLQIMQTMLPDLSPLEPDLFKEVLILCQDVQLLMAEER